MRWRPFILAASLVLAACSQAGGSPTSAPSTVAPAEAMAAAVRSVYEAGTAHIDFAMEMEVAGEAFTVEGDADADYGSDIQRMTMGFGGMPGWPEGMEMEFLLAGTTMYLRSEAFSPTVDPEVWIEVDLRDPPEGFEGLAELGTGQNDPTSYFDWAWGVEDATVVGTETIDGRETTHYRGAVDLEAAYTNAPPEVAERVEVALRGLKELGDVVMDMDVWVDGSGVLARQEITMTATDPTAGAMNMTITVDYGAIGEPIDVQEPTGDEVVDADDLE